VLSNLAKTRWLKDTTYNAFPELSAALQIRKNSKDEWGENASYAHLADYYFHSQPDSALFYSQQMYTVASNLKSPDDQLEALQKLITLAPPATTKHYFEQYQHLNDSLQNARNTARNQFALIRYEAEKNKADNLELQKQNTDKQSQITRQRLMLFSILTTSILVVTFLVLLSRRNKLRTSRKVHDVVANGLYRIMTEIQYLEELDRDRLLDKLEDLYERSRDISYEKQDSRRQAFHDELNELLKPFNSDTTTVLIEGNEEAFWKKAGLEARQELKYILQELMVNMKKHSSASNVVLKFGQDDNQIQIQYTDDGIGLSTQFRQGNGLNNTGNRIKAIGGKISFDTDTAQGLKILISFPTR
jgi:signal transduction histidine kinase